MSQTLTAGRVLTWSPTDPQRPDLLVHALAQLPDEITLRIGTASSDRSDLDLLARAYGISTRVSFGASRVTGASETVPGAPWRTVAELVEDLSQPEDDPASSRRDDRTFDGHRIGLVTNLAAPYRIPLFNGMAARLAATGACFRVFFLSERARARSWMSPSQELAFEHELLSSIELPIRARPPLVPLNLERRLASFRPTLLLSSGFSPAVSGRVARFSSRKGVTFGIWSGEHARMHTARGRLRRVQRRRLLGAADFAIAYGFAAGEYLRALRPNLPLVYGRNTSVVETEESNRSGSSGVVELLAVGDLSSRRKGIDVLVAALQRAPDLPCRLTIVGAGARLRGLEQQARGDKRIRFLGALPSQAVRASYAEADAFLFPSRADVFGLALVEAMGSGLAVVTSDKPGAVADLCVDQHNCLVVAGHDPGDWAGAVERVVLDCERRQRLALRARQTIRRRWTMEHAVDAMLAGLRLGILQARARGSIRMTARQRP